MSTEVNPDLAQVLKSLTIAEIIAASPSTAFGRADRRYREHLLKTVGALSAEEQVLIRLAAVNKCGGNYEQSLLRTDSVHSSKRRLCTLADTDVVSSRENKRQRLDEDMSDLSMSSEKDVFSIAGDDRRNEMTEGEQPVIPGGEGNQVEDDDTFLRPPPPEIIDKCIVNFIDRTSNAALAREVFMSCTRTVWRRDTTKYEVSQILNQELLHPYDHHPSYVLTKGMLLHHKVLEDSSGEGIEGRLCHDCLRDLKLSKRPKFSLANGMWVGEIPFELSVLTMAEKILIARYYPTAYVVKLFPKQKGARQWNSAGLNSGVRGNVSMYRLNVSDIADIVNPSILPPPASILAAIIAVTIIGPKGLPEKTMPGFLKVRRSRIRAALVWLKANNPFYANIEISEEMLLQFPENDIPLEILHTVKHSDDMEQLERERAGYIVEDDDVEIPNGT